MSADTSAVDKSTTKVGVEPLLLVARRGEYTAVWQVERDPRVSIGNFSGAWLLSSQGILGFASTAEWIPQDPQLLMKTLLRYPTVVLGHDLTETEDEFLDIQELGLKEGIRLLSVEDIVQTVLSAQKDTEAEVAEFLAASSGSTNRTPSWEKLTWEPIRLASQDHSSIEPDAQDAVDEALAWARGLRVFIKAWNDNEKIRKEKLRRLYPDAEVRPLPLYR